MAEAFGIAAGALGVAGLFNNCVDCFEYIQMARNFGRDLRTSQLRLDFAKLRLSRWGQAVNINGDPRFLQTSSNDKMLNLAREALWQILLLFSDAAQVSSKFKSRDVVIYDPNADTNVSFQDLHAKLRELARQRQKRTGLLEKAGWALYQSKHLDRLITDITDLIDELENLLPKAEAHDQLQRMVSEEVVTFNVSELHVIDETADDTDKLLRDGVKNQIQRLEGHSTGNIKMAEQARFQAGDHYSDAAVTSGYRPAQGAGSSVGDVDASGSARVHVGHSYGGRSVMDG